MSKRQNLVALEDSGDDVQPDIGADAVDTPGADQALILEDAVEDCDWDDHPRPRNLGWIVPLIAVAIVTGWTGFFGWVHQEALLRGATPLAWVELIVDWSIPVLLVAVLWLVSMRNSRREADRFGQAAHLLATESAALETRLATVNRELSLARDFIASQSRDLESLGRIASERLSKDAENLQNLIRNNGEQVNAIGTVSDTAVVNMEKLRDQLPVVSNAARDVANQIGAAGNTAQSQISEMASGFERLNEFGGASERQVEKLQSRVNDALAILEARMLGVEDHAERRFAALQNQNEQFRLELEARETDALASIRRRAAELESEIVQNSQEANQREQALVEQLRARLNELRKESELMTSSIQQAQDSSLKQWSTAVEQLQARFTEATTEIGRIDQEASESAQQRLSELRTYSQQTEEAFARTASEFDQKLAARRDASESFETEGLEKLKARFAAIDEDIVARQQEHLAHVVGLAERGDALAQRLAELDEQLARIAAQTGNEGENLREQSEDLAEKLSQSRAILEENSAFISRLTDDSVRLLEIIRSTADHSEGRLSDSIEQAEGRLSAFRASAQELENALASAEEKSANLIANLDKSASSTRDSVQTMETLETQVQALSASSNKLAQSARTELTSAIGELETASESIFTKLKSEQSDTVREIAERIGSSGSEAIERALQEGSKAAIADLEEAARLADEKGRATASLLRDQLARVNELAANLEQRVSRAREKAEEKVDGDFTRRMALITESLNSCAIDISRAYDTEVTDTAWASYLRGDRGIFTRRAVRLLDSHETRAVSEVYQEDGEFREAVNRYIHDFEGMLRNVLSTRNGNSMAVTLLSSDMGKLYVAMAQSIERLRD